MAVVAAIAVALPAAAVAATVSATSTQKAAIVKAFGDPAAASPCLTVLLAASDRDYATIRPSHAKRCLKWAFNGVNALQRVRGNSWKVVFEGSSYRCPVAHVPRQVQRDLGICR